jgi:hypothetical protein
LAELTCCGVLAVSCGSSERHLASTRTTTRYLEGHFLPGGIRALAGLMAMTLKVIGDHGEARDYFDVAPAGR